ncbi:MAG TPA: hypothetical protein VHN79_00250 [Lacunisphaera sp.]|nr:hypothetical protein [Lacunisphaera sp.]
MGRLILILIFVGMIVVYFGSLTWIYGDAERRGKPALLVTILAAAIAWPVSLLVWIALRPPLAPRDPGRRTFNLEDFREQ